ncbi:MAG: hypothetical protein RBR59_06375 [Sulfurimonadaceae bacterium]|jgi:N-glycosylase/DNA lyase|nr:hypothetical protein [Sulfurimonadaceae bacterium]
MQTIQINNPEIEKFISSQYGNDTQSLLNDFVKFVQSSLDDGYPAITKEEAKKRISEAILAIENDTATLINQEQYDNDMNEFMKNL